LAKFDFEKAMAKLEEIVADLESGELSLDESIKAFEQGVDISKKCHVKLAETDTKIKQLIKTEDGEFKLELFEDKSD